MQSSVNFIWFALLSHQKFDDRPLFKPGALICHHSEQPQNNFFCEIKIIFALDQFQTMQSLDQEKKIILLFQINFPNLLNDSHIIHKFLT